MKRIALAGVGLITLLALGLFVRSVIHQTVESRTTGKEYIVALGDSVAAGAGLGDSGTKRSAGCDVNQPAFPYLLGQRLHEPVEQFACSGAVIAAAGGSSSTIDAQYQLAKTYLKGSDVVVQVGANDIGWLQFLSDCTTSNCATVETHNALTAKLTPLQQNLATFLQKVQQDKPKKLVVNTYYSLLEPSDTCFAQYGISPEETVFINVEEARLNAAIISAATEAKATAVTVDFSGHLLCGADSWIQSVTGKAPLHPTAAGQAQIATQDAAAFTHTTQ